MTHENDIYAAIHRSRDTLRLSLSIVWITGEVTDGRGQTERRAGSGTRSPASNRDLIYIFRTTRSASNAFAAVSPRVLHPGNSGFSAV